MGRSDQFRQLLEGFAEEVDAYLDDQRLKDGGKKPKATPKRRKRDLLEDLDIYDLPPEEVQAVEEMIQALENTREEDLLIPTKKKNS